MRWNDADSVRFARDTVADLRAAYARYRGDPGLGRLVTEMLGVSPLFAEMWAAHEVAERRRIVYCPPPDSPTQATFQRLATQTAGTGPAHSP